MTKMKADESFQSLAWRPLLEGPQASLAMDALEAIRTTLPLNYPDPGLAGGACSAALFFAYLDRARPGEGWDVRSSAHLSQAVEQLGAEVIGPTLYSGFTGIAWTLDHLQDRAVDTEDEDPNEEIDAALLAYLGAGPWRGQYDLITGLVGYGLYGLDRAWRPAGRRILECVLDRLDDLKVTAEPGFTWHTAPGLIPPWQRESNPQGYVNLGLAHGIPGVIAMLAQAWAVGVRSDQSMALLEGSVAWLLAHRQPDGTGSCFPGVIPTGIAQGPTPSRVAWCYGDLGLSLALFWAARTLGRRDWEAEALAIAHHTAMRPRDTRGVRDAGLCHGAAGNAHLFNRLWQATRDPAFQKAATDAFAETLDFWTPGRGVGGFQAWMPQDTAGGSSFRWVDSPGLLEGAAGIGLALMAAIYPIQPDWDRMLLVSVPPVNRQNA